MRPKWHKARVLRSCLFPEFLQRCMFWLASQPLSEIGMGIFWNLFFWFCRRRIAFGSRFASYLSVFMRRLRLRLMDLLRFVVL